LYATGRILSSRTKAGVLPFFLLVIFLVFRKFLRICGSLSPLFFRKDLCYAEKKVPQLPVDKEKPTGGSGLGQSLLC
jgi:hypothetical protein